MVLAKMDYRKYTVRDLELLLLEGASPQIHLTVWLTLLSRIQNTATSTAYNPSAWPEEPDPRADSEPAGFIRVSPVGTGRPREWR